MCTICRELAAPHSPYVSTGLGNYYVVTPGHFRLELFFNQFAEKALKADMGRSIPGEASWILAHKIPHSFLRTSRFTALQDNDPSPGTYP